ncbi:MAG TPA: AsmA-like C-terminal region-containing protein [Cytophagales bacterium]|nr:AsmA-like C-terminal region-containing protein [Cytophagales bacterium]
MKKVIYIVLGIFAFLLIAAFLIPIFFKDQIKAKVDAELAKSVNAQIFYEADKFNLSLFRHFPNLTVSMEEFGIVNNAPFKGDTLTSINSFEIAVNLMSVISGDKIKINSVTLDEPRIFIKVLPNGIANYDIAIEDTTAMEDTTSEESEFALSVEGWEINNGYVVYDDRSSKTYAEIVDLDHSGSGDFTQDIFDLSTKTQVKALTVNYDGIDYFSKNQLDADITLNMDMPKSKYTFKDNNIKLNDFEFGFDGYLAMPDTSSYEMDLKFGAKKNEFKNILSLVPGVFLQGYEDLTTKGNLTFNGFAKGVYSDSKMPAFNLKLKVDDAMMKYADLPTSIDNINIDMEVDNKSGNLDNTVVNIKTFNMDMGKNPVKGRFLLKGLNEYDIDANIIAKINLADLSNMFPIEGLALKGLYDLDLKAKGVYKDSTQIPTIDARMSLTNGYVKSKDFPIPLEQVNFNSVVYNTTGRMEDTKVSVENFSMMLENEKLEAKAFVENLNDYTWDVWIKGGLDLEKLMKVYPIEGMTLTGKIYANITTKGKMSALDAGRYDQMPTSGTMSVKNFKYVSTDLPQGVSITDANLAFNPQSMVLNNFEGFAGKSDISLKGNVSNYIAYIVKPDAVIKGSLNFNSNKFNVNEWMTDEETVDADTASEPMSVFVVPKNIDFRLATSINQVLYDNLTLSDMKGNIIVKDGVLRLDNLAFNTLGGRMVMNGTYDSRDSLNPSYDFKLDIEKMQIKQAYQSFNTVQALAPAAKNVDGNFSTDFAIAGKLGQDMMPVYPSIYGKGIINLEEAKLQNLDLLTKINAVSKLTKGSGQIDISDVKIKAEIKDGRVHFEPFELKAGTQKMIIGGSQGIDGTLNYNISSDVPSGAAGKAVGGLITQATGQKVDIPETIKLNFKVLGTYEDPKISLLSSNKEQSATASTQEAVKTEVKEAVKEEVKTQTQEAKKEVTKEVEQVLKQDSPEEMQKEAEKAADRLKDKFGLPKKKK